MPCQGASVRIASIVAVAAMLLLAQPVAAAPMVGDDTRVSLVTNALLEFLGITTAATGGASLDTSGDPPVLVLPITAIGPGGIAHAGSGLSWTFAGLADPVGVSDLLFDAAGGTVEAFAVLPGFSGAVTFGDLLPGGVISIAPGFAALLDANGVPNAAILAGLVWGLIEEVPPVVSIPEPAALALFGFGLAGLAGLRRRGSSLSCG